MDVHIPSLKVRTTEADAGVVIVWTCPQCQKSRDFHMIMRNTALAVVDVAFSKSEDMIDLRCAQCAYELKVPASERPLLEIVKKLTADLKVGNLALDAYRAQLRTLPSAFMKDLLALTEVWKCPQCGEENPVGFGSCWKCGPESSGDEQETTDGGEPLLGFWPGGNAWEK